MTTPEPVTGATQDDDARLDAVAECVRRQFGSKSDSPVALAGHRLIARRFIAAVDAADAAAGIRRVTATSSHSAKLGWSNADTGPASVRLYATDQGESPRWAKPRARVIEDALTEAGSTEGDRFLVIRLGDRFSTGGAS